MHLNELEIANNIREGNLPSPYKYSNMWLVNIRITGTGMAYRSSLNEHVWRDPDIYLNDDFLSRINGLPVLRNHTDKSLLNDEEFKKRILGTVMLPYIKGDEVWAIVRIYNNEIIGEILTGTVSTSPAVSFDKDNDNISICDKDSTLLIEGKPDLVDHIALITEEKGSIGVWDKNNVPEGIEISNIKGNEMDKEELQNMLNNVASSIGSKFDALNKQVESRFDSVESTMKSFEVRLDSAKKDNHTESDINTNEEVKKEIAELKSRLDDKNEESQEKPEETKSEKQSDKPEGKKAEEAEKPKERKDASENQENFNRTAEDAGDEDRKDNDMIDARVKADSAYSACGKTSPRPFDGESSLAYRKRALSAMQKYSPEYKDVQIRNIADAATLAMAEKTIYADAVEAIKKDRQNTKGHLYEVIKTDAANRQIKTFEGDPNAWLSAFKMPPRAVVKFNTNGRMA